MSHLPQRKSPRLQGYDYAGAGGYFVTICTHQRLTCFGHIADGTMHMTPLGEVAAATWHTIPVVFQSVRLDAFVVMPNHVHGVLFLEDDAPKRPRLGTVINNYKGTVTRTARRQGHAPDHPIWQGRYHDHIIRDAADLHRIRHYVANNVACWQDDTFYTTRR